jgi:hypothetical protein
MGWGAEPLAEMWDSYKKASITIKIASSRATVLLRFQETGIYCKNRDKRGQNAINFFATWNVSTAHVSDFVFGYSPFGWILSILILFVVLLGPFGKMSLQYMKTVYFRFFPQPSKLIIHNHPDIRRHRACVPLNNLAKKRTEAQKEHSTTPCVVTRES